MYVVNLLITLQTFVTTCTPLVRPAAHPALHKQPALSPLCGTTTLQIPESKLSSSCAGELQLDTSVWSEGRVEMEVTFPSHRADMPLPCCTLLPNRNQSRLQRQSVTGHWCLWLSALTAEQHRGDNTMPAHGNSRALHAHAHCDQSRAHISC